MRVDRILLLTEMIALLPRLAQFGQLFEAALIVVTWHFVETEKIWENLALVQILDPRKGILLSNFSFNFNQLSLKLYKRSQEINSSEIMLLILCSCQPPVFKLFDISLWLFGTSKHSRYFVRDVCLHAIFTFNFAKFPSKTLEDAAN